MTTSGQAVEIYTQCLIAPEHWDQRAERSLCRDAVSVQINSIVATYRANILAAYDKAFKERSVKLSIQRGNISQVAKEVGVSDSQLSKWRKNFEEFGSNSFPGRGIERMTDDQREIKHLQK